MRIRLILTTLLLSFALSACADSEPALTEDEKYLNYYDCIDKLAFEHRESGKPGSGETEAIAQCLYHLE
ncbi:MAG: hypothetical protein FJW76_05860 [Actinobacteria bacterium]|nr:hypothetical protein [Actinomycetota bacterium]